ncbi:MAG: quinone-dependent dihydroorotate dehydrogenase [Bdellovibrionales bacterium]
MSFDIKNLQNLDAYALVRPLLFKMDPEAAHNLAIAVLKKGLLPKISNDFGPELRTSVCGLTFSNPFGMAAGFDKQAEAMNELFRLGFSCVETGTVTPNPQEGNPKPRMFRAPGNEALINRFGFNSIGFQQFLRHIIAWSDETQQKKPGILGINIGTNKDSASPIDDYVLGVRSFAPFAHYLTINVSSPNTPGLRNWQERGPLTDLLRNVFEARAGLSRKPPIFLKIAPDLNDSQAEDIVSVALELGVDALIISNTTVSRPAFLPKKFAEEKGGLSGRPLFEMSTELLRHIHVLTRGKLPLIGSGGVFTAEDAYAKIRAGASLVQIYTAMVYKGPYLVPKLCKGLKTLLMRDGFANVSQAVGVDAH